MGPLSLHEQGDEMQQLIKPEEERWGERDVQKIQGQLRADLLPPHVDRGEELLEEIKKV